MEYGMKNLIEKELTKMVNLMDYLLLGIKMDRRKKKELTRLENELDYGLIGMKTERNGPKSSWIKEKKLNEICI